MLPTRYAGVSLPCHERVVARAEHHAHPLASDAFHRLFGDGNGRLTLLHQAADSEAANEEPSRDGHDDNGEHRSDDDLDQREAVVDEGARARSTYDSRSIPHAGPSRRLRLLHLSSAAMWRTNGIRAKPRCG